MWDFISDRKSRDFFRFWFAQLISQFGDRVYQMALVGLMAVRHPGSVVEMAKLLSFTIIPVFIVGPIAGVYIDRWDRRRTLFVCDFIRGILVLLAAFYLIHLHDIWPMYVVVFIIFSFSRFYVPAKMSFIPEIVHEDDLHIANSLATTSGMIALVLGALLGGLIVEYTGSFGGFCWDAMCYFLSGALVFSIATLRRGFPNKSEIIAGTKDMLQSQKSVWHEIMEGIRYIRSQKEIGLILLMMSILFAAAGAIYVVIIVFIQQAFHSVTKDLGFLAVPLGLGLFLGSLSYGKWGRNVAAFKIIFWSLITGGAMVVLFACMVESTHNRFLALGLSLVLGYVVGPVMIASNTVVNKVCTMEMSGKVFAALEFVMHLSFLSAMLVSAFLAEHIERVWILVAVGGIFMVVGMVGLYSRPLASKKA
ncbi:MAG: MFS transporter [Candidatus Omnitrophica bacterium]|nr:MFS transporter [Candidatus Omnitrophota bacterium]